MNYCTLKFLREAFPFSSLSLGETFITFFADPLFIKMLSNKAKTEKSKAPRDPDAPKRFLSAFFLFCAKERAEVQKELPNCNGAAVTKELGKRWAVLDPEARKVFEEASKRDKERYEEEM